MAEKAEPIPVPVFETLKAILREYEPSALIVVVVDTRAQPVRNIANTPRQNSGTLMFRILPNVGVTRGLPAAAAPHLQRANTRRPTRQYLQHGKRGKSLDPRRAGRAGRRPRYHDRFARSK